MGVEALANSQETKFKKVAVKDRRGKEIECYQSRGGYLVQGRSRQKL